MGKLAVPLVVQQVNFLCCHIGQMVGKARYHAKARAFVNLSAGAIEAVWESFNDVADGFGISLGEMQLICQELTSELEIGRPLLDKQVEALFIRMDSDENALVDAIEFVSTLAMTSGMSAHDKLEFVFTCFDFDGAGQLSVDEITLAFRCTLMGLCKLTGQICPCEEELEVVAMRAFAAVNPSYKDGKDSEHPVDINTSLALAKLRILDAISFCLSDPEALSWLEFFDDPDPIASLSGEVPESVSQRDEEVNRPPTGKAKVPVLLESIDYKPTQQDIDYTQDGNYPAGTTAASAALEGAPELASKLAALAEKARNPRGEVEPWVTSVASLAPTALANAPPELSLPSANLSLEWVHGYRGEDCRGNVRYTSAGEIVYPVARMGIVYSPLEHQQRYMTGHASDIVSFAIAPDGCTAATGETGARPSLICWDVVLCAPLAILAGVHAVAITQLAFSPSGERLASLSGDIGRTLIVYLWRTGVRIFSGRSDHLGTILGVSFVGDSPDSVAACGSGEPYTCFWRREGAKIVRRRGAFGRRGRRQPTLCLARCGDVILSGQASGHLYVWHGRNCVQAIRAHRGSLNALFVGALGALSGGKDGKVRQWSHALEPGASFDLTELGANPTIRSVCLSNDGAKLLVGTGGNEIYELSAADGSDALGGPVTSSHFGRAMRGIACHPLKPEFATCGADSTVRAWDITTRNPVRTAKLDAPVSCVCYHPNGDLLAVGLGNSSAAGELRMPPNPKTGGFCVLNDADLSIAFEARDSTLPLVACRFSPDGEVLAFASEDCSVYLYASAEEYESIGQCRRHPAPIRCIDFSKDSRWLRSCCDAGQLHFFNANSAQYQSNLSALKDLRWATETCYFGYGVAGVYGATRRDGAQLTACARARAGDDGPESGGGVLATGDSYGRIRLARFPSRQDGARFEWRGHAGVVVAATFNSDETHLLTAGRDDRCVMQWILTEDERDVEDADDRDEDEAEDYAPELRDNHEFKRTLDCEIAVDIANELALAAEQEVTRTTDDAKAGVDAEFAQPEAPYSRDPWYLTMTTPPQPRPRAPSAPTDALTLSRVFGYSCSASRNNAKYTECGAVIYPAGGTLVRVDLGSGAQSFGTAHAGFEICALAISLDKSIVATSDIGSDPQIALWSTSNIASGPSRIIRGPHSNAVTLLAFDDDKGERIASIGADSNHTVAVHDVSSGYLLFTSPTTKRKPLDLAFGRLGNEMAIVGVKHALFFTFMAGHAATRHASASFARIGRHGALQAFLCCAYLPSGHCIVGTADGHLFVFGGSSRELEKSIKAHDGFIYAMDAPWCRSRNSNTFGGPSVVALVTGARDGDIRLWNDALEMVSKFDNHGAGPVRSVFISADLSRVLVGSQAATQLREFRASDGVPVSAPIAGGGAAAGESWGLASHPTLQRFAAASDEGALALWDAEALDVRTARLGGTLLAGACRALAYSPDGRLIAACLGGPRSSNATLSWARRRRDFEDGKIKKRGVDEDETSTVSANVRTDGLLQLLRAETGALVYEFTDVREWLRDVKFSPDGQTMVAGGTDGNVHVYGCDDHGQFSRKASLTLSKGAAVCTVDFTCDGRHIQASDEARALSYGDLHVGVVVRDPAILREANWATWTSPFGWPVIGAHAIHARPEAGGYETSTTDAIDDAKSVLNLTCVSRSNSARVIATGDCHGVLRTLRYPASNAEAAASKIGVAHVGVVRRLVWTAQDSHLITVGGLDRVICVWRYEPDFADFDDDLGSSTEKGPRDYDDAIDADGGRAMAAAVERSSKATNFHVAASQSASDSQKNKPTTVAAWISALVPPSNLEQEDPGAPQISLKLECAHGQRSDDVRGLVGYNAQGGVVYACGALGVVYDSRTHTQCFHFHHPQGGDPSCGDPCMDDDGVISGLADISALNVSHDGRFAASGDQGKTPRVRVWDALTGNTISVLPRHLRGGVLVLSFSRDGRHLAAIGSDPDHSYALYTTRSGGWEDATRVAAGSGTQSRVFCAAFVGREAYPFFVGSYDSVEFARPAASGGIRRRRGTFDGRRCPNVPILCVTRAHIVATDVSPTSQTELGVDVRNSRDVSTRRPLSDADSDAAALTGSVSGSLYLWSGTEVAEHVPDAHDGPIYAVTTAHKRGAYATAGRDGAIKTWDARLQPMLSFRLSEASIPFLTPTAAAISFGGAHGTKILILVRSGEMCELAINSGRVVLLTEAHARRKKQATEAHGLDVNPKHGDIYATSGDDGTVRVWSCASRRCVMRVTPDVLGGAAARCCSWAPDGIRLAVGLGGDPADKARDGTLIILNMKLEEDTPELLTEVRKSKAALADVKWCDDGTFLLAASEDSRVYIHDARDCSLRTVCAKAGAPLACIDLSVDASHFQVATQTNELHFYSVLDGTRIASPAVVRDTKWMTMTVPLGWNVQGCWKCAGGHTAEGSAVDDAERAPRFLKAISNTTKQDSAPHVTSVHRSPNSRYLAKGCVDGTVAVYNYPTHAPGMAMVNVPGHASSIAKVRFTSDGKRLVALGQFNRTITQYEIMFGGTVTADE